METKNLLNELIDLSKTEARDLIINGEGIVEINLLNKVFDSLIINVKNNSSIIINDFNQDSLMKSKITFNVEDNSTLIYNLANKVRTNYDLEIYLNFNGSNSIIKTNIHSLVSGKENIKVVGSVGKNKTNNEMLENIKVILEDSGASIVKPDMLIDNNLVEANHKVAISSVSEEYLFYLESKGISKEESERIIKKSFLLSNISNEELKEKIEKFI